MFGYSEFFNDFHYDDCDGIDFICFTDDPELRSAFWRMELVTQSLLDPIRTSKQRKILPHRFLAHYDYSLYLDNTIRLKQPASDVYRHLLATVDAPLVCFRHPNRRCIYDEADAVIEAAYDDPSRVRAQMSLYRTLGYPAGNGLFASGFMLRRHNDRKLIDTMEYWYEQILCHSYRDQLSLPVAAWQHPVKMDCLDLDLRCNDIMEWPIIKGNRRVPRDFDDARYLRLNPDITTAPRWHYLHHGAAEGRQYK